MISFEYFFRLLRLYFHYNKKSSKLPYAPVRLWVELTSLCNYRCIMCPNKEMNKEAHGTMDFALYKKIIDEASGFAFDINLAHRGESLLHPQIVEAILYAKSKGLFTRLHTNGSLLTEELAHKILESGLDRLSFSFDGFDKDTYESTRIGGNFEKTLQNIIRFLEIKKEKKSKKPNTSIEVINFDAGNRLQTKKEFEAQFKELPLDSFVIKDLHNWAGETNKAQTSKHYSACTFPWNALVVFWDGTVLPCTQDFFGHYTLGHVKETPLLDIWNNDKSTHLRSKLTEAQINEFQTCSKCDRPWRKRLFGVPREYLWKFIRNKMP
ncbi:MAG: radical SAM protein [Candidatus Aminicenantes bacterium]|nr:radical SAM protein [Candidatus Aminicenantes bacterium]